MILKRLVKHNYTYFLRTQFFTQNGVKIPPDSRTEYAEDMYPTGVRLVVSTVTSYAEYTCKVTNEAGSANVTAYIYAITGKNQCFQSVLMIYFHTNVKQSKTKTCDILFGYTYFVCLCCQSVNCFGRVFSVC